MQGWLLIRTKPGIGKAGSFLHPAIRRAMFSSEGAPDSLRDLHSVLELKKHASKEDIKQAYYRLAK